MTLPPTLTFGCKTQLFGKLWYNHSNEVSQGYKLSVSVKLHSLWGVRVGRERKQAATTTTTTTETKQEVSLFPATAKFTVNYFT